MRALVKRVERNQKQTQSLLDQLEKDEDVLLDSTKLADSMKRAEHIDEKQQICL